MALPNDIRRLLVVLPTWVGDCVMATPLLRALRSSLPDTEIVGFGPRATARILNGLPFLDRLRTRRPGDSLVEQAARLRTAQFDASILLPGSFKAALLARLAGVPRRIGYARDGRGWLLTDRLRPPTVGRWPRRRWAVTPTRDYYLRLLDPLGLTAANSQLELAVTPAERGRAESVLASAGIANRPFVLLNPGANYGAAKLWPPTHFAALADRLAAECGLAIAISVAPKERAIAGEIVAAAKSPIADLSAHGLTLGAVKELCHRADLVVTNDTGTRHVAVAMGTRVVTLFGPTDERWTTLDYAREIELSAAVPCRPCQQKTCPLPPPLTKRCMIELTPDNAFAACERLLGTAVPLRVAS